MELIKNCLLNTVAIVVLSGVLLYLAGKFIDIFVWALDRLLMLLEVKVAFLQFIRRRYHCTCGALQPTELENSLDKVRKQLQ